MDIRNGAHAYYYGHAHVLACRMRRNRAAMVSYPNNGLDSTALQIEAFEQALAASLRSEQQEVRAAELFPFSDAAALMSSPN